MPEIFAASVATTFVVVVIAFFVYDVMVTRRNEKLVTNAAQSNALVSSLFPGIFRDRVLDERAEKTKQQKEKKQQQLLSHRKAANLQAFLNSGDIDGGKHHNKEVHVVDSKKAPLADTFQATTVLFADLVGESKFLICERNQSVTEWVLTL